MEQKQIVNYLNHTGQYRLPRFGLPGRDSLSLNYKSAACTATRGNTTMLHYALLFLLIALVAGIIGFGGFAFMAAGIARILFGVFLVLFLVGLIMHVGRSSPVA